MNARPDDLPLPALLACFENTTARNLQAAAVAVQRWEAVKGWDVDPGVHLEANVSWSVGSLMTGCPILQAEVSRIVGERLGALICEARDRIEANAREAFFRAVAGDPRES